MISALLTVALGLSVVTAGDVNGVRTCAGADTLQHLAQEWARMLHATHPGAEVRISTDAKLSADGFQSLLEGRTACAPFVRELFASERTKFAAAFGYEPLLVPVAGGSYATPGGTHAIAIYVNAANPLQHRTMAQLAAILTKDHPLRTWGELGLKGAWATKPITVYGMLRTRPSGDPPGIVNFMRTRVLAGGEMRDDLHEQRDSPGETALQGIVARVAEDETGLGYSGFGFARDGAKTVALGENANGPFFTGTRAEVANHRYPLARSVYVLVNRPPGRPLDPVIAAFLETALSTEGQAALARDREQFLPLIEKDRAAAAREITRDAGISQHRDGERAK